MKKAENLYPGYGTPPEPPSPWKAEENQALESPDAPHRGIMAVLDYFCDIWDVFFGTCKGLWVTLRTLFKPAVTVQYPKEKLVPYPGFRGALLYDIELCISCSLCVKACPSDCITLENAMNEAGKKLAKADWYAIDLGKCNFCRLCEEACPTKPKSVWHSLDYELVFDRREEMVRLWKRPSDFIGRYWDPDVQELKRPKGQVQIQTVQARKL